MKSGLGRRREGGMEDRPTLSRAISGQPPAFSRRAYMRVALGAAGERLRGIASRARPPDEFLAVRLVMNLRWRLPSTPGSAGKVVLHARCLRTHDFILNALPPGRA